jgi:peptide/nickel transport system substrate-binding protein
MNRLTDRERRGIGVAMRSRFHRGRRATLLGALFVVASAATCLSSAATASVAAATTGATRQVLRIGLPVDADSLDPSETDAQDTMSIAHLLWGTLYKTSSDGKLDPYFAVSAKLSDDGRAYTFKLRPDLKCENGAPLTARDVAYSFDHPADPKFKFTGHASGFVLPALRYTGARVDDPLTVTIQFAAYNPIALGLIAEMFIFCRAPYEAMTPEYAASHASATGPYRLVEWRHDDRIVLERNKSYGLPASPYDGVVFRVIPEASTRTAELLAGNLDIMSGVVADQIDAINHSGTAKVESVASIRRIYVGFNQNPKFAASAGGKAIRDPRVRRALQFAVDVPTLCDALLRTPCARMATMIFPPNDKTGIRADPFDPDRAETLLDQAGYKRGADGVRFALTLQTPRGRYPNDVNIALAIAQYLTDIGVKTTVDVLDFASVFVPLVRQHVAGPLFLMGSSGASWSALYDLSDFPAPDGGSNYSDFADPEFFAGWKQIDQTHDPEEQAKVVRAMMNVFHERGTWLNLYFLPDLYGVSNKISWRPRADELITLD